MKSPMRIFIVNGHMKSLIYEKSGANTNDYNSAQQYSTAVDVPRRHDGFAHGRHLGYSNISPGGMSLSTSVKAVASVQRTYPHGRHLGYSNILI